MSLSRDGFAVFAPEPSMLAWASAALNIAAQIAQDPAARTQHLRHRQTWFVGVDALPSEVDGAIAGAALDGAWRTHVPDLPQHRAQLSIIYPGYPGRDAGETDGQHRFRVDRAAAHVDGLLPEGRDRRRFAREYHGYILGIPLGRCAAAPTLVWPSSHHVMGTALRAAIGDQPVGSVDVTDAYAAARRAVFDAIDPVPLDVPPGGCFLLHRHALHGTQPWGDAPDDPQGRMIAFLRPELASAAQWLSED